MKINQIIINETTTAGSVATVSSPLGEIQSRNASIYGDKKVGSLLKGKKTNKPYANSLNEGKMKDLDYDLKTLKPAEFQKKYGKKREEIIASFKEKPQQKSQQVPVSEAELSEDDVILVPGQGRKLKSGLIPHGKSRVDHEVEMARSDLFSAAKNAEKVLDMIKDISEDEGLEGWVQEKIIKANDYLNTIREYLEGKRMQEMSGGVIAAGGVGESVVKEKAVSKAQQRFMGMAHAIQKGKKIPGASKELKDVAKGMSKKAGHDFAATKHKGLPEKVKKKD
jgi:hypothetical protein